MWKGIVKFALSPSISLHRLKHLGRYAKIYQHMYITREKQIDHELSLYFEDQKQKQEEESIKKRVLFWASKFGKSFPIKGNLSNQNESESESERNSRKIELSAEKAKQIGAEAQEMAKHYANKAFNFMALYYESLQALIEGRREVVHNKDFQFEDGKTVAEKEKELEEMLLKMMGKSLKNTK